MSWLAKSLANSLRLSLEQQQQEERSESEPDSDSESESESDTPTTNRTVNDDLSDLTQTLTRQLWGVASLLSDHDRDQPAGAESPRRIEGIRSDLAEIGSQFRTGISLISGGRVATEVSKIASSLIRFGSEEDDDAGAGIDEQVVVFVKDLVLHPKTWTDFPQFDADLGLSEAQEEHILAMEQLVPELTDLKNELCQSPGCMHECRFWTIYFLLLIPTLAKDEAELLSSPQIMKARGLILEGTEAKPRNQPEHPDTEPSDTVAATVRETSDEEKVILPIQTEECIPQTFDAQQIIDKTVTEEELMTDQGYNWFDEEMDEAAQGTGKIGAGPVGQVEVDVSFSDLEEEDDNDDDDAFVIKMKKVVVTENNEGTGTGFSLESNKSSEWLQIDDLVVD